MLMKRRILVVDDQSRKREHLEALTNTEDYLFETLSDADAIESRLCQEHFHIGVVTVESAGYPGIAWLRKRKGDHRAPGWIVRCPFSDQSLLDQLLTLGVEELVDREDSPERLGQVVSRVIERQNLREEREQIQRRLRAEWRFHGLVSKCARMWRIFDLIEGVSDIEMSLVIQGERGSGKVVTARAVHAAGGRSGSPLEVFSCAGRDARVLEVELFGSDKRTHSGRSDRRAGALERARGGTLLLREPFALPLSVQARLMRALESGELVQDRIGSRAPLDLRIVVTADSRLDDALRRRQFCTQLYHRLCGMRIDLPPLRERKEDIPLLCHHFLERYRTRSTPPVTEIAPEAMRVLIEHDWPDNVRELESTIRAAVTLANGAAIDRESLPSRLVAEGCSDQAKCDLIDTTRSLPEVTGELIARVERAYLTELLDRYRGQIGLCARHSGISRQSLTQKLLKHGLDRSAFRRSRSRGTRRFSRIEATGARS
jgi:DNA-binding NtrC family response regulator